MDTGWWNVARVRALFNPNVASDVLKILLSPGEHKDVLVWRHEKNGVYSVKSGYRFLISQNSLDNTESSSAREMNKVWKSIWHMKAPNKVKIFAWRACQDSLPSKQNLFKRKVTDNTACPLCSFPMEDGTHAILKCQDAQNVWLKLMPILVDPSVFTTITDAVNFLLRRGDQGLLSRFFLIAWSLWYRRNKWAIEHVLLDPFQVASYAINTYKPSLPLKQEPSYQMQRAGCWQAPPSGSYKLNVDAALFFDLKKAGVGAVLRDGKGEVVLAVSKAEHELHDPDSAEMLAMFRGLQFILHLGISKIVLESDSLLMVETLTASQESLSLQGNLLMEVRNLLSCFEEHHVQHVLRSGNQVAHALAKHAWSIADTDLWMGSVPSFYLQYFWLDIQSCNHLV